MAQSLGGWTGLVLEGVFEQKGNVSSLDELFITCNPLAAVRYPENRHVREKLRQQLQRLRDLGLVELLGGGTYRRLIAWEGTEQ